MTMEQTSLDRQRVLETLQSPEFDGVVVACHASPDGDACGSAHALVWALRLLGRKARVYCPDPFPARFSFLTSQETKQEPFEARHFVTVDIAAPEMLRDAPFLDRIDLAIDHHRVNTVSAREKWVSPQWASCGEMILSLVESLGVPMTAPLAEALYTAIVCDTGRFQFSNTNENTYLAAARLFPYLQIERFQRINKLLFETRSRKELALEKYALEKMRFFASDRAVLLSVTRQEQAALDVAYEEMSDLIQVIRRADGVVLALVVKEKEEGEFKVSVRTECGIDASAFCAVFGGGGHLGAAGCTLYGTEDEVLARLCRQVERSLS